MVFFAFRFIFALWVEVGSWGGGTHLGMKRSRLFTDGMDGCWLAWQREEELPAAPFLSANWRYTYT